MLFGTLKNETIQFCHPLGCLQRGEKGEKCFLLITLNIKVLKDLLCIKVTLYLTLRVFDPRRNYVINK